MEISTNISTKSKFLHIKSLYYIPGTNSCVLNYKIRNKTSESSKITKYAYAILLFLKHFCLKISILGQSCSRCNGVCKLLTPTLRSRWRQQLTTDVTENVPISLWHVLFDKCWSKAWNLKGFSGDISSRHVCILRCLFCYLC